ncbi:MAG: recombinase family protein [Chloroflexi bacterium]|nr:recombinase family protein [Chloroflexota bacterium]
MKVVIYARVSSDAQDVDLSLSAQLRSLREYAAKSGHEVVREFVDEAESGRSCDRPAFREMIALAKMKQPPFQAILVWKLNRFARNRMDSVTYKALLRNKGIQVISINEPTGDSPQGQLLEGIIECMDEFYSANMGQDIRRGMRENATRGFYNGSIPPYGFRAVEVNDKGKTRKKLEPEPDDSAPIKVVRSIFKMAQFGKGCKEIAKSLNSDGFRTMTMKRWSRTTVYKILTNEVYCGTLVWGGKNGFAAAKRGDKPVRIENAWPAIIDEVAFNFIQSQMKERGPKMTHPRKVSSFYLLSGVLRCACGSAMTGHSAKSGKYFYYMCSRSYRQGKDACAQIMLPKDKLEEAVVDQILTRILSDASIEDMVETMNDVLKLQAGELGDKLKTIDSQLKDVQNRLARLYDVLETGKLGLDELAPRIRELKTRQDELSKSRVLIEAEISAEGATQVDIEMVKSYVTDLRWILQDTEVSRVKGFLKTFIESIVVNGREIVINYTLPLAPNGKYEDKLRVLPIDTIGGEEGTRTPTPCGT